MFTTLKCWKALGVFSPCQSYIGPFKELLFWYCSIYTAEVTPWCVQELEGMIVVHQQWWLLSTAMV